MVRKVSLCYGMNRAKAVRFLLTVRRLTDGRNVMVVTIVVRNMKPSPLSMFSGAMPALLKVTVVLALCVQVW